MIDRRSCGVLLHVTSLPSAFGVGDLGPGARRFLDFLAEARQTWWQILPLGPTGPGFGNSPYSGTSAFAGNELLISPALLVEDGLLDRKDLEEPPAVVPDTVDFEGCRSFKRRLFAKAFGTFKDGGGEREEDYRRFLDAQGHWLGDFALFSALDARFPDRHWGEWPQGLRDRNPDAVERAREEQRADVEYYTFLQYVFHRQWNALKKECGRRGIRILGDMPLYVDYHSADVWSRPEFFKLDERKRPEGLSGAPPDYFSKTGQLWGNPVYRWEELERRDWEWWFRRIRHNLDLFDGIRIDHFRGFVAFWEVPAGSKTAENGRWVKAPAERFFDALSARISPLPILAEDLGIITPDVRRVMSRYGFPGMKVLLFAFGEDNPGHPYLPHNYHRRGVVYTGTHDNNTARGWFEKEAAPGDRERLFRYVGREVPADEVPDVLVRLAMMSVADLTIFPLQDLLGLGEEARMNRPATHEGNWRWRLDETLLTGDVRRALGEKTLLYGRASP